MTPHVCVFAPVFRLGTSFVVLPSCYHHRIGRPGSGKGGLAWSTKKHMKGWFGLVVRFSIARAFPHVRIRSSVMWAPEPMSPDLIVAVSFPFSLEQQQGYQWLQNDIDSVFARVGSQSSHAFCTRFAAEPRCTAMGCVFGHAECRPCSSRRGHPSDQCYKGLCVPTADHGFVCINRMRGRGKATRDEATTKEDCEAKCERRCKAYDWNRTSCNLFDSMDAETCSASKNERSARKIYSHEKTCEINSRSYPKTPTPWPFIVCVPRLRARRPARSGDARWPGTAPVYPV